jgi:hypothetical protein
MSGGRPSTYDPAFCDRVIDWGKQGKSKAWMAAELGVHRDTVNEWERVHPEFSDAITRALLYSQQWWEDMGQDNLLADRFQASMWSRSMAARFPHEWREKMAHVGGEDTDPAIQHKVTRIELVAAEHDRKS